MKPFEQITHKGSFRNSCNQLWSYIGNKSKCPGLKYISLLQMQESSKPWSSNAQFGFSFSDRIRTFLLTCLWYWRTDICSKYLLLRMYVYCIFMQQKLYKILFFQKLPAKIAKNNTKGFQPQKISWWLHGSTRVFSSFSYNFMVAIK